MQSRFKLGAVVTVVVSLLATVAICVTFVSNASPYVDVTQALTSSGDALHLLGSIDKHTVHVDVLDKKITFDLTDAKGKRIHVIYQGEPISNIDAADKVVAVGSVVHGEFNANKLNIKCPSKYEDGRGGTAKPA
jgi:cytochrome c-type biogenesis protein CcmE